MPDEGKGGDPSRFRLRFNPIPPRSSWGFDAMKLDPRGHEARLGFSSSPVVYRPACETVSKGVAGFHAAEGRFVRVDFRNFAV